MSVDLPRWIWEPTDPARSVSSGDISKVFRYEETDNPGIMADNAPPPVATLMAREVIQNSWDAARELQRDDPEAPSFEIEFAFNILRSEDAKKLTTRLDLRGLRDRAASIDRYKIGLNERDCLTDLDSSDEIKVLIIKESGTSGMYGPWTGANSKMYLALVSLGFTEKESGAGGSYGYGKAGLIRASSIRTVVAYSCFREREDDPAITRRLLGMTYWGQHTVSGTNYTGFARFGSEADGNVAPFENDDADEIAAALGLELRDPERPEDLGTTFIVVDPRVDPEDLVGAVNRSWWPALQEGAFDVSVRTADRRHLHPRPMQDPVLRSFIEAYAVATTPQDNTQEHVKQVNFGGLSEPELSTLGSLGLVADLKGWSYADQAVLATDDHIIEHRSLVALMRGPRMVVEYYDAGRSAPFVRGVFVASDGEVDDLLRLTEPKAHDSWQTKSYDGDLDGRATGVAKAVISRIRQHVGIFRNNIKPPTPPPEDVNLPFFDRFIRTVLSGKGSGWTPPIPETRPISIRLDQRLEAVGGQIRLIGSAKFALSEHHQGDEDDVEVSVRYRYMEDERVGDFIPLEVGRPSNFNPKTGEVGAFVGVLERNREATFEFKSSPYPAYWTGRLFANGEIAKPTQPTSDEEEE